MRVQFSQYQAELAHIAMLQHNWVPSLASGMAVFGFQHVSFAVILLTFHPFNNPIFPCQML